MSEDELRLETLKLLKKVFAYYGYFPDESWISPLQDEWNILRKIYFETITHNQNKYGYVGYIGDRNGWILDMGADVESAMFTEKFFDDLKKENL